jgi:small subunit ribosomal protein S8
MTTDPLADLCARIRNAYQVRHKSVAVPYSKIKEEIAKILVAEEYLKEMKVEGEGKEKRLVLTLRYKDKEPVLTGIKRVSRPGRRLYTRADKIPVVLSGLGISIISTPQGLMTNRKAREKNLGGEIICCVW